MTTWLHMHLFVNLPMCRRQTHCQLPESILGSLTDPIRCYESVHTAMQPQDKRRQCVGLSNSPFGQALLGPGLA